MHPILRDHRRLALYLGAWLAVGLLLTLPAGEASGDWVGAALLLVPLSLVYGFVCLASWYPCRANPLPPTPPARALAVQLVAAVLSGGLWLALGRAWVMIAGTTEGAAGMAEIFSSQVPALFAAGVLLYLLAAAVHYLLLAWEASQEAARRTLELQLLARQAELETFKTQIDPHFLFNCLNSISGLCSSDPEAARRMAVRLGDFLRASLRLSATDRIPLAQELDLSRAYLEVEGIRYGDRLQVDESIEAGCEDVPVPALVLQPLLENALKHGIAHLVDGGVVELRAGIDQGQLRLEVANPRDPDEVRRDDDGIGLANVRGRLDLMFDRPARLEVEEGPRSFLVRLRLPIPAPETAGV